MKIECKRSYIQAFLKDKKLRKSCLDYGLTVDQLSAYPDVDSETKEVVEYVFGEIVQGGYLPIASAYGLPEGFEQYGEYAKVEGIDGFFVVKFCNGTSDQWRAFSTLKEAEDSVDPEYQELMREFEASERESISTREPTK